MSSPIRPPLKIETLDGATEGRPINTIRVSNGTLSVSGTTATITTGGGGGGSGTVTSVGTSQAFITITSPTTTPSISIGNASGAATGVLTAANWSTFNGKQDSITLTTTGSSGAATLVGSTLNIPQYSGGGGGTFSGSLADTQVAFGNTAADSIQGSSNLTFDGSNLSVSGYIKSGAGLVTAPTYTFTAADDVGMYLTGTNILHFTAGNSDLMNLQHDGTATNVRLGNGTGGAALSSKGLTNLTLQTNDGTNSGTIVIEDGVNGQISITPNGSGTIKLDGVELDNTAIATGYVLKATSATEAGWAAESGGGVTFPLEADSGSLSNPSYSFSGDTNTGMYSSTADNLNFVTDGSMRATINSNGLSLGDNTDVGKISSLGSNNLLLQTNNGTNSGKIEITDGVNNDIELIPNGTGKVKLGTLPFKADQTVGASEDNFVLTYDNASDSISLEAAGGGGITWATPIDSSITIDTNAAYDLGGVAAGSKALNTVFTKKLMLGDGGGTGILTTQGTGNSLIMTTNDGSTTGYILINAGSNSDILLNPNGTGKVNLGNLPFKADQTVGAGQDEYVLTYDNASNSISLVAASAGGGNDFNAELVGVELDASGTGYAVFDILSSPPYGVARYTTGGVDTKQYFYPFIAPKSGSLSEIIVNLTAAAGSATNLYYGFYRDNNGVPDSMLGYATVDATSTGSISVTSFSATVTFTRGDQFWLSQNKSTSQSITQRSIQNDYMPRIAPTEAFPNTTSGYYTSLATNSAVSAVPADITAEGLEGGVYFSGLGSKPHIGIKIL